MSETQIIQSRKVKLKRKERVNKQTSTTDPHEPDINAIKFLQIYFYIYNLYLQIIFLQRLYNRHRRKKYSNNKYKRPKWI